MKTQFIKKRFYNAKYYIINAEQKILGRLATKISELLTGKINSYYSPGIDQGNFVIIINANKIILSKKTKLTTRYYKPTQRPGNLKYLTFKDLIKKNSSQIIMKAVWGMLPKNKLGNSFLKRLFVFGDNNIQYKSKGPLFATLNYE